MPWVEAAKYWGVPLWEMIDKPVIWRDMALVMIGFEAKMRNNQGTPDSPSGGPAPRIDL
jgi:hypothetical protein